MSLSHISGHGMIDYIVVMLFVIGAIYCALTKPERILYLMPAALTFYFFVVFVTILTPIKIVPPIFILVTILANKRNYLSMTPQVWSKLLLAMVFGATWIGIIYTASIHLSVETPHLKSRLIVQFTSYLNMVLVFLILRRECNSEKMLMVFLRAFVYTTTILSIYGLYQYLAFFTGLPFRGLVRGYGANVSVAFDPNNFIFRINSFVTEPKRFSYVLGLAIVMILGLRRLKGDAFFSKRKTNLLLFLHGIALFLTYATSIYFAIALYTALILVLLIWNKFLRYYIRLFMVGAVFLGIALPFVWERAVLLYELRVLENLESRRSEDYALEYVLTYPEKFIFGVGPGNYNFLLSMEYPFGEAGITRYGFLHTLNSGLMTVLYDFGLLGGILLFWPVAACCINPRRYTNETARQISVPALVFLLATSAVLNPLPVYYAFVGAFEGTRSKYADDET